MKRLTAVMFAIAIVRCAWCGMTTHLLIDNRYISGELVTLGVDDQSTSIPLDIDLFITTKAEGAVAQVLDNGALCLESTVPMQVVWSTTVPGVHTLTYQVVVDGEHVGEAETFQVEVWLSPKIEIGCDGYAETTMQQRFPTTYVEIEEIVLREGVTNIVDSMFAGCTNLVKVTIPDSVASIGANAFADCSSLASVELPEGVTDIPASAFDGCNALSSVTIPTSVTNIASTAFVGCSNITDVVYGATIAETEYVHEEAIIGNMSSFDQNASIVGYETQGQMPGLLYADTMPEYTMYVYRTRMWFAAGVTYYFSASFDDKSSVKVDDTMVVTANSNYDCRYQSGSISFNVSGFHEIELRGWNRAGAGGANSTTCTGFFWWTNLDTTARKFDGTESGCVNATLSTIFPDAYDGIKRLTLSEGMTRIPDGFAEGCDSLEYISIPSTITDFGDNDFREIGEVMGESGMWIENGWLLGYIGEAPRDVEIPEGVVGIASYAFADQYDIESVSFPSTLKYIGVGAFETCVSIEELEFNEGLERIDDRAFKDCTYVGEIYMPSSVKEIGANAFENNSMLVGIELNEGLVEIGDFAFSNCWRMISASVPVSLEAAGEKVFMDCRGLLGVTTTAHVKSMAELFPSAYATMGSIVIAEGETNLVAEIFAGCTNITTIVLPDEIVDIPDGAFDGCTKLSDFAFPSAVTNIGERAFRNVKAFTALTEIVIPDSVRLVGTNSFAGCSLVRSITIPGEGVAVKSAFPNAYSLITDAKVTGESGELGDDLFADCVKLSAVDIPTSITNIGARAFKNCSGIAEIGIPSGVKAIGSAAFYNCTLLKSIALPEGLTAIADQVFYGCSTLQELMIPESVVSLGANMIYGTSDLTKISYLGNAPEYDDATYAGAAESLVSYVINGSTGWDGVTASKSIPETWPSNNARPMDFFEANRFEVAFNGNGGEPAVTSVVETTGTTYVVPESAACAGWRFSGWWSQADIGGGQVTAMTKVTLTRSHTLYAHWTPNEYAIQFVGGEGAIGEMDEVAMTCGTAKALAANSFRKANADFAGWATEEGGAAVYADGAEVVDLTFEDGAVVTLYAVWTAREWNAGDYIAESEWEFAADAASDADWVPDTVNYVSAPGSMRSGAIGAAEDGGRTCSTMTAKVVGGGAGSFKWAVDCEEPYLEAGDWYDYVVFMIDGVEVAKIAGTVGWTNVEFAVTGAGEHTLAWTFTRDDYDEDGSDYENAAWVDDFVFTRTPVTLSFAAGEGTEGEVPAAITMYAGAEVTLPGVGSMKNGYSVFGGWTDGENVYAAGATYVFGSADAILTAVWSEHEWTPGEILGATNLVFTTGGDLDWVADFATNHDGVVSMKSGAIGDSQSTYIEAAFEGTGELSFWWKVSGQVNGSRYYDYAKVELDGTEVCRAGDVDWTNLVISVTNSGSHVVRWTYLKNASGAYGYDAAWLDEVVWTTIHIHVESVTKAAQAATCEENGWTEEVVCSDCGETLVASETIPALGHVEVVTKEAKDATYYTDGWTEEVTCSRCGNVITESETIAMLTDPVTFVWTGAAGDGNWKNAGNWKVGDEVAVYCPGQRTKDDGSGVYSDCVVINDETTFNIPEGESVRCWCMTLNADVTFTGGGSLENSKYKNKARLNIAGDGKLILSGFNIISSYSTYNSASSNAISNDIVVVEGTTNALVTASNGDYRYSNWQLYGAVSGAGVLNLAGSANHSFNWIGLNGEIGDFTGRLEIDSVKTYLSSTNIAASVRLADGVRVVTYAATTTLSGPTFEVIGEGNEMANQNENCGFLIKSKLIGDGELTFNGTRAKNELSWDASEFTGSITIADDGIRRHNVRLGGVDATNSNMTWKVYNGATGSSRLTFGATGRVYRFGSLSGVVFDIPGGHLTYEIGALGKDDNLMLMAGDTSVNAEGRGIYIRKVGSGTLTMEASNTSFNNLEYAYILNGGTLVVNAGAEAYLGEPTTELDDYEIVATKNYDTDGETLISTTYILKEKSSSSWSAAESAADEASAGEVWADISDALTNANAKALAAWATTNGVDFADSVSIKLEAFLLNCANTDAAIAEAEEEFTIPAITINADGSVTVTPPEGDYNGSISILGAESPGGEWHEQSDGDRFFKAELTLP